MKKLLLAVSFLLVFGLSFAQSPLGVGATQVNIGVGMSNWGVPFYAGFDYGFHRDFTFGGEFSYRGYRENWNKKYYDHSIMGFSGNGNYHFNTILGLPRQFDFYAGLNIGFFVWSSPDEYNGSHNSGLGLGGQLGGRFYFTDRLGLNVEFGGSNAFSGGKVGLTIKM